MSKNTFEIISKIKETEEKSKVSCESEANYEVIERLKKHTEEIFEIAGKYNDTYEFINPSGRKIEEDRLSYEEEIEIFKKEIENNSDYNPVFTYLEIEKLDEKELNEKIKALEKKKEEIELEESDTHIKKIVGECIETSLAKIKFLLAVKNKDDAGAYKYSVEAYGDIDKKLVDEADEFYKKKFNDNSAYNNPLRKKLKEIKLTSQDLKDIFQIAKEILEIKDFEIVLDKDVKAVSVSDLGDKIKIPENKKYSGDRVLDLTDHEIGTHAVSLDNSREAGFPGISAGKNATTSQEGLAIYTEQEEQEHIFGDYWPNDKDWFIYAMDYRKKGNGFGKTYLEMKDRIKKQFLIQKIDEKSAEKDSGEKALMVCRRIFRGMHNLSSESTFYYTKDAAYFKGYAESIKVAEKGLDHYITDLRIDPYLIPYFMSLKAIPKKALHVNRKVIEAMWDIKGFSRDFLENYPFYANNTQMDRHMAYREQFGQIDEEIRSAREEMEKKSDN